MKKLVMLGGAEIECPPFAEASVDLAEMAARRLLDGETNPIKVTLDMEDGGRVEVALTQDDIDNTSVNIKVPVVMLDSIEPDVNLT